MLSSEDTREFKASMCEFNVATSLLWLTSKRLCLCLVDVLETTTPGEERLVDVGDGAGAGATTELAGSEFTTVGVGGAVVLHVSTINYK